MSAPIDDGGPAFPRSGSNWDEGTTTRKYGPAVRGMSLRDWFAGQALACVAHLYIGGTAPKDLVAGDCYRLADEMLAERKRGGAS